MFIIPVEKAREHLRMHLGRENDAGEADFQIPVDLNPIISHPYLMQFQFHLAKVRHSCFVLERVKALIGCSADGHRSRSTDKMSHISQENRSTAARATRCGESFVGDNPNPSKHYPECHCFLSAPSISPWYNSLLGQESWRQN